MNNQKTIAIDALMQAHYSYVMSLAEANDDVSRLSPGVIRFLQAILAFLFGVILGKIGWPEGIGGLLIGSLIGFGLMLLVLRGPVSKRPPTTWEVEQEFQRALLQVPVYVLAKATKSREFTERERRLIYEHLDMFHQGWTLRT